MSSPTHQKQGPCKADLREAMLVSVLLEHSPAYVPSRDDADKYLEEYKSPAKSRGGKPSYIEERAQVLWARRSTVVREFLERNYGDDVRTQISAVRCALRRLYAAISTDEPAVEIEGATSADAISVGLLTRDEELIGVA